MSVPSTEATRNMPIVEQAGFITPCNEGEYRPWELMGVSVRGC